MRCKARTLIVEFGWFGFGMLSTGLFPGVCLGPARVLWVRGTLHDAIKAAMARMGQ